MTLTLILGWWVTPLLAFLVFFALFLYELSKPQHYLEFSITQLVWFVLAFAVPANIILGHYL